MLSVEEALERILRDVSPLPSETVSIAQAAGRALAEDAVSRVTQPPADVSAMDGYALRGTDVVFSRKPDPNFLSLDVKLDEVAWAAHIRETLEASRGNQSECARRLGISERVLRYKLQKYHLK